MYINPTVVKASNISLDFSPSIYLKFGNLYKKFYLHSLFSSLDCAPPSFSESAPRRKSAIIPHLTSSSHCMRNLHLLSSLVCYPSLLFRSLPSSSSCCTSLPSPLTLKSPRYLFFSLNFSNELDNFFLSRSSVLSNMLMLLLYICSKVETKLFFCNHFLSTKLALNLF